MQIRSLQMELLEQHAQRSFVARLAQYILRTHPKVSVRMNGGSGTVGDISATALMTGVESGIQRARNYGLTWESSIASFVVLMFVAAPNFHEHPDVRAILEDPSIPPERRMFEIRRRIIPQTWEEVKSSYDRQGWN